MNISLKISLYMEVSFLPSDPLFLMKDSMYSQRGKSRIFLFIAILKGDTISGKQTLVVKIVAKWKGCTHVYLRKYSQLWISQNPPKLLISQSKLFWSQKIYFEISIFRDNGS